MDIGAINPTDGGFQRSFDIIIMVVLGGLGSISGAVVAAICKLIKDSIIKDCFTRNSFFAAQYVRTTAHSFPEVRFRAS